LDSTEFVFGGRYRDEKKKQIWDLAEPESSKIGGKVSGSVRKRDFFTHPLTQFLTPRTSPAASRLGGREKNYVGGDDSTERVGGDNWLQNQEEEKKSGNQEGRILTMSVSSWCRWLSRDQIRHMGLPGVEGLGGLARLFPRI